MLKLITIVVVLLIVSLGATFAKAAFVSPRLVLNVINK